MYLVIGAEAAIEDFRRSVLGMENLDFDVEEVVRFLVDYINSELASPENTEPLLTLASPEAQNLVIQGFVHHTLGYPRGHEDGAILTKAMQELLKRLTEDLVSQRVVGRVDGSQPIPAFHGMLGDDIVLKT